MLLQIDRDGCDRVQSSRDLEYSERHRRGRPRGESVRGRERGNRALFRYRSESAHSRGDQCRQREKVQVSIQEKSFRQRSPLHSVPIVRLKGPPVALRNEQTPKMAIEYDHAYYRTSYARKFWFSVDEKVPGMVGHLGQTHEVGVL